MCVADLLESSVSRRHFLGASLATGLAVSAVDWSRSLLLPAVAEGAETPPRNGGPGSSGVNFKWLGTDAWEITLGNKTILLDPWVSRTDAGIFSGKPNLDTLLTLETAIIDRHVPKAEVRGRRGGSVPHHRLPRRRPARRRGGARGGRAEIRRRASVKSRCLLTESAGRR